eukprot:2225606-Lingulodinium_polyedra.AAC.1
MPANRCHGWPRLIAAGIEPARTNAALRQHGLAATGRGSASDHRQRWSAPGPLGPRRTCTSWGSTSGRCTTPRATVATGVAWACAWPP